ncbi:MAG: hypothetical protein RML94_01855, partial [Bacteroidia bacterium]|nr:hypothetical protein [Bacteroidia bacterium]
MVHAYKSSIDIFWACPCGHLACAHAHKVGVLRATLSLRCFASLRTAYAPFACLTQQPWNVLPYLHTYS